MNKQQPIQEGETWRAAAETTERMAARCRLKVAQYEQRVLLPAIEAAEKKANLLDEGPLLHRRAMRAAGTAGFRTARGLRRWIENVTWRWRRKAQHREAAAARAKRQEPRAEAVPAWASEEAGKVGGSRARAAAEREERASRERKALEVAAEEREAARLGGIERRRTRARRTVLGAEAAARAQTGQDASAEWATKRSRQLQEHSQEACWAILRPLLGLKAATYGELIERKHRAEGEVRAGLRPRSDQKLLARRKSWRQARVDAWTRVGDRIRRNAAAQEKTPHEAIAGAITPRHPMP